MNMPESTTALESRPPSADRDGYVGCLLGTAIGDALGDFSALLREGAVKSGQSECASQLPSVEDQSHAQRSPSGKLIASNGPPIR